MNRNKLKNLYDVINKIARNHKNKGEDFVDKWFLTTKQVAELKKNPKNKFI